MLNKRRRRQPPSSIPRAQKKRNKKGFFLLTASRQNVGPKVEQNVQQNVQQNVEQNVEQNVRQNVQQNVKQMLNKCWTFSFKIPWPPPSRSALPPVSVLPSLSFCLGWGGRGAILEILAMFRICLNILFHILMNIGGAQFHPLRSKKKVSFY